MREAGTYHGYLQSGVVATSKNSGTEQMAITFKVPHIAKDGDWAPVAEFNTTIYLSFSDAAWEYTEAKLRALGFNGVFDAPEFNETATTDGVDLVCRHEEYQGKPTEKWDLASFGGGPKKAEQNVVSKLQARWDNLNRGKPAGKPAAPPAAKRPAPKTAMAGVGAEDPKPSDIPF